MKSEIISKPEAATGSAIKQLPDLALQFIPCFEDNPKAPRMRARTPASVGGNRAPLNGLFMS